MTDIIGAVVAVGFLVLWIYCIYDVITTDDAIIQHLPKVVWILIVVLLSDLGSLLWLGLGRPHVGRDEPTIRHIELTVKRVSTPAEAMGKGQGRTRSFDIAKNKLDCDCRGTAQPPRRGTATP